MELKKQGLLCLFVLLFSMQCLLSSGTLPLRGEEHKALEEDIAREMRMLDGVFGRMDMESNDYPGSGANNRHDPKSPGKP